MNDTSFPQDFFDGNDVEDVLSHEPDKKSENLTDWEKDQNQLNECLLTLSTQFAQIQFRLKQIANSEGKTKEELLSELHDYAFKGVDDFEKLQKEEEGRKSKKILERQSTLICSMQEKLQEMEKQAERDGKFLNMDIIQKQKTALKKLNEKMKISLETSDLTPSEIRQHADEAIREFINPYKEKHELVEQLQTQIVDLERFVAVLQNEAIVATSNEASPIPTSFNFNYTSDSKPSIFSFGSKKFQKNQLKNSLRYSHYGDERAHLELAVCEYENVLGKYTLLLIEHNDSSENNQVSPIKDEEIFKQSQEEVVTIVRKRLAPTLKALLEHGMRTKTSTPSSKSIGCLSYRKKETNTLVSTSITHIWDVIQYFYNINNGDSRFLDAAPKLSQTFGLDVVAGRSMTSKEVLMGTIDEIVSSHSKLRRSKDSQWKAFVSAALNSKKLPSWIRIIFRTRAIVESCYHSYSYVARTGCDELYSLFENLHKYDVFIPVDLALKPFEQIKEAF